MMGLEIGSVGCSCNRSADSCLAILEIREIIHQAYISQVHLPGSSTSLTLVSLMEKYW
jgi:hypothetical protein